MNEANHNANSFDIESIWYGEGEHSQQQPQVDQSSTDSSETSVAENSPQTTTEQEDSLMAKMDWQRVAHKLREYNRKLLKKVFRLEQELAETENKFKEQIEKSRNADSLLARQAEELEEAQAKIALSIEKLASSQQQRDERELAIKQLSEQHEITQQQFAQLERECTLLQEKCNQNTFAIAAKEQENESLRSELKVYQEAELRKEQAANRNQNYPHNRFIQPWSSSTMTEPKIALPRNKIPSERVKKMPAKSSATTRTAAEIATWSASVESRPQVKKTSTSQASKSNKTNKTNKTQQTKKPQSLAAVDLPTFPRPN